MFKRFNKKQWLIIASLVLFLGVLFVTLLGQCVIAIIKMSLGQKL